MSDHGPSRAPVLAIKANGVNGETRRAHAGTIVAAVTGSIAAILVVLVVFALARRRRRRQRRKSIASFDITAGSSLALITPFEPIPLSEASSRNNSATWAEQRQLVFDPPEAGIIPEPHDLSSAPPPVPPSPNVRPVAPVTVGLSGKELARLRAEGRNAQQTIPSSLSNEPRPTSSSAIVVEQGGATSTFEAQRLQSVVESLQREMQQLRTERFEAPPSYTSGDV